MKKMFLVISLVLLVAAANAQKDTAHPPPVKYDTLLIMSYDEANRLVTYLQLQASGEADVKADIWRQEIQLIMNRLKLVPKETPKK